MVRTFSAPLGGDTILIETGKLAQQAGGAVLIRSGDSVALVTATANKTAREGTDFFPLTVDYEERQYAAGKIPGGFFKREGRPTDEAILTCRLIDRPLRPLFPKGMRNDVHVVVTPLSADQEHALDILGIIGASAALTISDIPFHGPIGAARIGYIEGQLVVNPTSSQVERSALDLRVAGTKDAVLMVEAGANEVPEELMLEAIVLGHQAYQDVIRMQETMQAEIGKPKGEYTIYTLPDEVVEAVQKQLGGRLEETLSTLTVKAEREAAIEALQSEVATALAERYESLDIRNAFEQVLRAAMRKQILEKGIRPDGRDAKTIRPIHCEVGLLPRTHGSGLFTRGETQVLTLATLGTVSDEQVLEGLEVVGSKRYMHHYNFPPYSTGEAGRLRGPGRREIGHGALAERALLPVLPSQEEFPYTIRLVSEVLSSNGSTSMASACASTLALMDAGVKIKAPVGGVAMGLVKEGDRYVILTDILGMEDALGDMDFKVTGTAKGITALQMDIKISGLDAKILREALEQAREGRLFILEKMRETIAAPRAELSPYAPRITMIKINPEKIGKVIGPGGKTIRSIIEQSGAEIDIEDDGSVFIAATSGQSSDQAVRLIHELTEEPEIGKIYTGKVTRITDFGAFVEFMPGQEGMVHISQLADYRVPSVADVVHVGDEIMVMVTNIDSEGKIRLSRQAVLEGWTAEKARERDQRPRPRSGEKRPMRRDGDRRSSYGGDRHRRRDDHS